MRKFLASVGNAQLLGKVGGTLQHIADVRTLTDSTLSFSNSMDEIRAGEGAQLYGRFSHDAGMTIQLTDAMFDINYVALQVGAAMSSIGGKVSPTGVGTVTAFVDEPKEVQLAAAATSVSLPFSDEEAKLGAACGLDKYVVWYRIKGCSEEDGWKAIASDSKITTIGGFKSSTEDRTVCVKYMKNAGNANSLFVNANFIPAELVLILTTKLFAGDANAPETGKPVGEITVKIPRFQLDGQFDLSMAMSSPASMSLNGTALAVSDGTCEQGGIYAEIVELEYNTAAFTGLKDLVIDPDLSTKASVTVLGLYADGHVSTLGSVAAGAVGTPGVISLGATKTTKGQITVAFSDAVGDQNTTTTLTAKLQESPVATTSWADVAGVEDEYKYTTPNA